MKTPTYEIIYPVHRRVTGGWIIDQAKDQLATEYMAQNPHADDAAVQENSRVRTVAQAMEILSDAGMVTFTQEARDAAGEV